VPVCFGISFAQTALNQASSLVNLYVDGRSSVSTGAVEMGQGRQHQDPAHRRQDAGASSRTRCRRLDQHLAHPQRLPTSASTERDLNGMATRTACEKLYARLQAFAAQHLKAPDPKEIAIRDEVIYVGGEKVELSWEKLVAAAQWARVDLGEHAFYATPDLHYDLEAERGRPFAYYAYGTSLTEVLLDVVRGTYTIEAVDVVHDVGTPISETVDRARSRARWCRASLGDARADPLRRRRQVLTA
jgi:xanthine dehydrogenase large subunit